MGVRVNIGSIAVDSDFARKYAEQFDPFPAHLTGDGNAILPDNSISGLYILAEVMKLVVAASPGLLASSKMQVLWKLPVVEGDTLDLMMTRENYGQKSMVVVEVRRGGVVVSTVSVTQHVEVAA